MVKIDSLESVEESFELQILCEDETKDKSQISKKNIGYLETVVSQTDRNKSLVSSDLQLPFGEVEVVTWRRHKGVSGGW